MSGNFQKTSQKLFILHCFAMIINQQQNYHIWNGLSYFSQYSFRLSLRIQPYLHRVGIVIHTPGYHIGPRCRHSPCQESPPDSLEDGNFWNNNFPPPNNDNTPNSLSTIPFFCSQLIYERYNASSWLSHVGAKTIMGL